MTLGIDIGTSTISIVVGNADGECICKYNIPNDSCLPQEAGSYLQDPDKIANTVLDYYQRIIKQYDIQRIGITAQMHGILYVDDLGNAVSPLFTWENEDGLALDDSGMCYLDRLNTICGTHMVRGIAFGALTHYRMTCKKSIPEKSRYFCSIGDYIGMKLTNNPAPHVHISMAASFGLYDLEKQNFDTEAILKADMDPAFFPDIVRGCFCIGVTAEGIPVSAAIGDNQASFLGSVLDWDKEILLNLGTGGQISCFSKTIIEENGIETRPLLDDDYLNVYTSHCGGRAYAALERFFQDIVSLAGVPCDNMYAAMENAVLKIETQRRQPIKVNPAFCGSRIDPLAKCEITNISLENFTAADLSLGFLNGICEELLCFYKQRKDIGRFKQITGSGNAIRLNKAMQHAVQRTFGLPLKLTDKPEEAAFGAIKVAEWMTA